ncbi:MAG: SPASM domain-containing protein [Clostridia bacterium]|nr:SPASM domain-containing protein [Clostridia bacterium]
MGATNGTLLPQKKDVLLSAPSLRKISVSLHSFEANGKEDLASYLNGVTDFYRDLTANKKETYLALRLWNEGGRNQKNEEIIARLSEILRVDVAALPEKNGSKKIKPNLFLESASRFDWPSLGAENQAVTFCHGLTRQIGVLCDGTVVPCCLDSEGTIALGNLFTDSLTDVLQSPRAEEIRRGFACRHPSEELCRKCGYATRFR